MARRSSAKNEIQDPSAPQKKRARWRVIGSAVLALAALIVLPFALESEPGRQLGDVDVRMPPRTELGKMDSVWPRGSRGAPESAASSTAAATATPSAATMANGAIVSANDKTRVNMKPAYVDSAGRSSGAPAVGAPAGAVAKVTPLPPPSVAAKIVDPVQAIVVAKEKSQRAGNGSAAPVVRSKAAAKGAPAAGSPAATTATTPGKVLKIAKAPRVVPKSANAAPANGKPVNQKPARKSAATIVAAKPATTSKPPRVSRAAAQSKSGQAQSTRSKSAHSKSAKPNNANGPAKVAKLTKKPRPKPPPIPQRRTDPNQIRAASPSGYVVQIGAFSTRRGALAQVKLGKKLGFEPYTEKIATRKGDRIRVRIGPYLTREQADAARGKLKSAGVDTALIAP